jgi:hypothetical protein
MRGTIFMVLARFSLGDGLGCGGGVEEENYCLFTVSVRCQWMEMLSLVVDLISI